MQKRKSTRLFQKKPLKICDLVNHLLYGPDWLAIVLEIGEEEERSWHRRSIMVHMVPGTTYDNHFAKSYISRKESNLSGWVSENWLRKIEKEFS